MRFMVRTQRAPALTYVSSSSSHHTDCRLYPANMKKAAEPPLLPHLRHNFIADLLNIERLSLRAWAGGRTNTALLHLFSLAALKRSVCYVTRDFSFNRKVPFMLRLHPSQSIRQRSHHVKPFVRRLRVGGHPCLSEDEARRGPADDFSNPPS